MTSNLLPVTVPHCGTLVCQCVCHDISPHRRCAFLSIVDGRHIRDALELKCFAELRYENMYTWSDQALSYDYCIL